MVYPADGGGGICTDWITGLNATRKINGYKWGECIPLKHSPPHWEREGCQDWVGQQKVRSRGREIDVFQHFVDVLVGDRRSKFTEVCHGHYQGCSQWQKCVPYNH